MRRRAVLGTGVLLAIVILGAGAWWVARRTGAQGAGASTPAREKKPLTATELAQVVLRGAVVLHCADSSGAGFFVAPNLVVTNAHVLCRQGETMRVVRVDGSETTASEAARDDERDLAVVRTADDRGDALNLGDAGALSVGDPVVLVGSPVGMDFTVHQGSISNLSRSEVGIAYVQIDAKVNPGNSGGPLVDKYGLVVGVVTMKRMDAEGIGIVVPINYAYGLLTPLAADLVEPPSPAFDEMRRRAEEVSEREAAKLRQAGQRPGLVGAQAQGNMMLAQVVWPLAFEPTTRQLTFELRSGKDEMLCTAEGETAGWAKLEASSGGSPLPQRIKGWLDRHGFGSDLYVGMFLLNWQACPDDQLAKATVLMLQAADSDAARILLQ